MKRYVQWLSFLIGVTVWVQPSPLPGEEAPKIDLNYIYKKNELNIPPLDPDLPKDFKWSNQGHWLAYRVSFATEEAALTVYDPVKDATVAWVTPQNLYHAVNTIQNGSEEVTLENPAQATPSPRNATDFIKISRYTWHDEINTLWLHLEGKRYRFDPVSMRLRKSPEPEKPALPDGEKHNLTDSPNERYAAYIRENDLYVYDTEEEKEIQVTHDGSESVLNARLTWVYWEELYHRQGYRGYAWSPDSSRIAYMQFDETGVSTYPVTDFSTPIPQTRNMFYPKAGTRNPTVRIGVVSLSTRHTQWMDLGEPYEYIARFGWSPKGKVLFVQTLNRAQDELTLHFVDPVSGASRKVLTESDEAWVNVNGGPFFLENEDDFLWLSERSGFRHLYRYDRQGTPKRQLTDGDWEVVYDHWREEDNFVMDEEHNRWFIKTSKESPIEQHGYTLSLRTGRLRRITSEPGQHSLEVSADRRYVLNRVRNTHLPQRIQVMDDKGKIIRILGETRLEDYEPYSMQVPEIFTLQDDEGHTFYAKITKPLDFDPNRTYPVICSIYGGPGAQTVRNAPLSTREMMFVNEGYILFSMDNRGSKGRGRAWEKALYKQFGTIELEDLLKGIRHLKTLPYIDADNIGIWGWSYGGYFSCIAMTKASDVFRAGAAVAPVTDFHLYDTIYTERYMQTPAQNPEGYHNADVSNFAGQMDGALLLAHGISDDNVHIQNVYQLVDTLIEAEKEYELNLFPEKDHGIGGNSDQYYLFQRILQFFAKHLKE